VHECDAITCAPWSDPLVTATQASDQVTFTLDSVSNVIGTGTLGKDGTFTAFATIPLNTPTGSHSLGASGGGKGAIAPISVCSASGCAPAIGVVGDNGGVEPPGSVVIVLGAVTVKGSSFAPGQTVSIAVDNTVNVVGSTTVASDGTFKTTFTMPSVAGGSHTLYATEYRQESKPGPFGSTITVSVPTQTASVSVWVELLR
jgi:hypothetical protein